MSWIALRRASDNDPWQLMSITDDQPARPQDPGEYRMLNLDDPTEGIAVNIPPIDAAINQMLVGAQEIRVASGLPMLTEPEADALAPVAIGYILDPRRVPLTVIRLPKIVPVSGEATYLYEPGHWVSGCGIVNVDYVWQKDGADVDGTMNTEDFEYTSSDYGSTITVHETATDGRGQTQTADSNELVPAASGV